MYRSIHTHVHVPRNEKKKLRELIKMRVFFLFLFEQWDHQTTLCAEVVCVAAEKKKWRETHFHVEKHTHKRRGVLNDRGRYTHDVPSVSKEER